jgi:hypothetical protein
MLGRRDKQSVSIFAVDDDKIEEMTRHDTAHKRLLDTHNTDTLPGGDLSLLIVSLLLLLLLILYP